MKIPRSKLEAGVLAGMNPACESTYRFVWFVSANLRFVVVKFFPAFFICAGPEEGGLDIT
jgi:hypothetical protein